jgi:hypothetical protein
VNPAISSVITPDHLDLLVTAAVRYRVLVDAATAAASEGASHITTVATPNEAGQLLLEENLATVLRHAVGSTRSDQQRPPDYVHRPVDQFQPIEVVKAVHCYQHLCAVNPSWGSSTAAGLAAAILHAATERLPGYDEAAWSWTRASTRTGEPVGLRRRWQPVAQGVRWLPADELAAAWDNAALVLLTDEAIEDVPAGLPSRGGVYVCTGAAIDPGTWGGLEALQPDVVVMLPAGREWLVEQLRNPIGAYRRTRPDPSPPVSAVDG